MNKIKFLMLVLAVPFMAFSQETPSYPIDPDTKLISYQGVVQQNGTQDELYIRGIAWLNSFYKNPADVSRVRNRESGIIEVLHRIEITNQAGDATLQAGIVNYELKLEFKPGRYRYTISNLTLRQASKFPIERWLDKSDQNYLPIYDQYMQQVDTKVKEIIANLKAGMEPEEVKPEEKW